MGLLKFIAILNRSLITKEVLMKIFLLWCRDSERGRNIDPKNVASSLQKIFSPLFSKTLSTTIKKNSLATMVFLELPVSGWVVPFFQEDEQTWAFAGDYPINVRGALDEKGIRYQEDNLLPTLGRSLQIDTTPLLQEISPPFSMIWSSKQTDEIFIQNDGLGQSQLFEYQDSPFLAISNKIIAFKALGIPLELEKEQWAARSMIGWFPQNMTGYKRIQYFGPSTKLCINSNGVHRTSYDILSGWVNHRGLSRNACLELAYDSL